MSSLSIDVVISALRAVCHDGTRTYALHEPCFEGNEQVYVKDCIDTGWVSSLGRYVDAFEKRLCEATGSPFAVAVVNGTAALHVCLKLCGVEQGTEVVIPALSFVATANAVAYTGAVPHFVDSAEDTLGIDPVKLRDHLRRISMREGDRLMNRKTGRVIAAIVPMHTFGHPVDMDPLLEVAAEYGLTVIEDAAESIGSLYKGRHTGTFGRIAALSFNGNKTITTGGGGAILTADPELARLAKHLTTTAKVPHRWAFFHDAMGFNYRLPNLNAALGVAQLELLATFVDRKRAIAERYERAFRGVEGVTFLREPPFARSNYWLNAIVLDNGQESSRDSLLEATHAVGIMTRPAWELLSSLPMYQTCPRGDLSTAESLVRRIINIPSSPALAVERL